MLAPAEELQTIRNALPKEGLFADKDWLISPQAFPISEKFARELEQMGHKVLRGQRVGGPGNAVVIGDKQLEGSSTSGNSGIGGI